MGAEALRYFWRPAPDPDGVTALLDAGAGRFLMLNDSSASVKFLLLRLLILFLLKFESPHTETADHDAPQPLI